MPYSIAVGLATTAIVAFPLSPLGAQEPDSSAGTRAVTGSVRAQAVALVTRVDPAMNGRTYTEGYLTQPIIMAHASALRGHVSAVLTLDFEGLTMDRGQLTPGAYGEGYADRRHPHTYLHEALLVGVGAFGQTGVSLAVGKGFVPFGTDDPMVRPFAAYPVNHHLAQILERYVTVGAVRYARIGFEAALFNGDEPLSAGAPPDASRFGDSWATRVTVAATSALELQGSFASVTSPELVNGAGLDQRKWSASAQLDRPGRRVPYALAELARTEALLGDVRTNTYTSALAEASVAVRWLTISGRYENTTRPEEQRLLDPFRTSRSPADLGVIGITRWQIGSVAASGTRTLGRFDVAPFLEASLSRPTEELATSAFVPRDFYGATSLWALSAGVRLGLGDMHHRMGRYGAAVPNAPSRGTHGTPHPPHPGH